MRRLPTKLCLGQRARGGAVESQEVRQEPEMLRGVLLPSDVAGASKRDRIRSDVVNSRLPDPRLDLIYRLEASAGDPQE